MHSRIFVIATTEEIISGDYEVPSPSEVVENIWLSDSSEILGKPEDEKEKDIQRFKDVYGKDVIQEQIVLENEFGEKVVAYKINKDALKKALEGSFDNTISKILEIANRMPKNGEEKASMIDEIHLTVLPAGFYFFSTGSGFMGETDLYYEINYLKNKDIYIIATIDYHM